MRLGAPPRGTSAAHGRPCRPRCAAPRGSSQQAPEDRVACAAVLSRNEVLQVSEYRSRATPLDKLRGAEPSRCENRAISASRNRALFSSSFFQATTTPARNRSRIRSGRMACPIGVDPERPQQDGRREHGEHDRGDRACPTDPASDDQGRPGDHLQPGSTTALRLRK